MKISTKGRYALRVLIDLAEHKDDGFVALRDIALRQDISKKYLEQIIPILNRSGILLTNRGHQGGYKLAKAPSEIIIGEVLRNTEGSLAPVSCLEQSPNQCKRCHECVTLPIWVGLERVVNQYLDGITLNDILEQKNNSINDYII